MVMKKRQPWTRLFVAATLLVAGLAYGEHFVSDVSALPKVFDLGEQRVWKVSFRTTAPTKADLFIHDADLKVVRHFSDPEFRSEHSFEWDGKDENGQAVPTQIYTYRIQTQDEQGDVIGENPFLLTAAQDTLAFWPKWDKEKKQIRFRLERDALVRVRVGLKDGPLLATPANWTPALKGRPSVPWDGWDQGRAVDYSEATNLHIHVDATSLPENFIYVRNPESAEPTDYAQAEWLKEAVAFNQSINPKQYRIAKSIVGTVKETGAVAIQTPWPLEEDGAFLLAEKAAVTVTFPELQGKDAANAYYEALYFLDGSFVTEADLQGSAVEYELDPERLGPGLHTLVVNVILGSGRVGTASLKIKVP